jgi:hypothetical protein
MLLVDADGRVVSGDVRGDLEREVARLLDKDGEAPRTKTEHFPVGLLVGGLVGCVVGSLGGALVERAIRRPKPGPPTPPEADRRAAL